MIDFIIGGLILIAVIFAIRKVIKNQKSGGCGCGCAGCSSENECGAYENFEAQVKEALQEKNKE